ncbi:MAG TPA: heavy-metal-associated domain-containing protein [Chloroflexota bacterium]|nr:heavy-metal-associated domain-containing protein [Chloroflexota bacterium]
MQTISLTAPDISCEHCRATIEREIGTMPGVTSVAVDVPSKRVVVNYDPDQTSETAIITRLDEEGYPAGQ